MKKQERFFYPAIFTYNGKKEIAVVFPDLGCATSGEDEADALLSARELLGCVLCGLEDDGEPIPKASHLSNIKTGKNEKSILIFSTLIAPNIVKVIGKNVFLSISKVILISLNISS